VGDRDTAQPCPPCSKSNTRTVFKLREQHCNTMEQRLRLRVATPEHMLPTTSPLPSSAQPTPLWPPNAAW